MHQAAFLDCLCLDLLSTSQNDFSPSEVDICRRQVSKALVISMVVIVINEVTDRLFKRSWKIVVFKQDAVLQGLMPTFDLTLGLSQMNTLT